MLKEIQSRKTAIPSVLTLFGKVISVNALHPLNAKELIVFKFFGSLTEDREEQCSNAPSSIYVTLLGNSTDSNKVFS